MPLSGSHQLNPDPMSSDTSACTCDTGLIKMYRPLPFLQMPGFLSRSLGKWRILLQMTKEQAFPVCPPKRVWSTPSMPSDTWRQGSSVPMCRRPTWPAIPSLHLSIDRSWKQQTAASENCFPFSPRRMCFWLWLTMEMTRTSGTANIRGSVFPFWCTGRELPEKGWVSGNPFPMWAQACAIISG